MLKLILAHRWQSEGKKESRVPNVGAMNDNLLRPEGIGASDPGGLRVAARKQVSVGVPTRQVWGLRHHRADRVDRGPSDLAS